MAVGSEWDTYFAFILIRNLCINLRGWCQIGSWEGGWWRTVRFMWRSITIWKGRERPTNSWWTLGSQSNVAVFRTCLLTSSGTVATEEITQASFTTFTLMLSVWKQSWPCAAERFGTKTCSINSFVWMMYQIKCDDVVNNNAQRFLHSELENTLKQCSLLLFAEGGTHLGCSCGIDWNWFSRT